MTEYFNFLGLPLVVQDLITNEIVHNSFPEDRIQLALTSKYCSELVQRARPKKIIDKFSIGSFSSFTFIANSREYTKTKEQLMEILPNCQIKRLVLGDESPMFNEDYSEILGMLSEAARFATKFIFISCNSDHMDKFVEFYVKLKHLKSAMLWGIHSILPYYPSKMRLVLGHRQPEIILEDLAKKSQNRPLSFLKLDSDVSLNDCQQFLQIAKFSTGAEIRIQNDFPHRAAYLTYVGQNNFTFEMFPNDSLPIFISQKFVGKNRRIKLKTSFGFPSDLAFNVISASNPNKNYFSGVFEEVQQLINLENVDRDETLKVKFVDQSNDVTQNFVRPRYTAKMLESAFPTANFRTPEERVENINNVLGTNIQLIQAEDFAQTVEVFRKINSN